MYPILFQLGPLKFHSYGVLLMLGFVAAVAWSIREGKRRGIRSEDIVDTGLLLLVSGLIGARALYVVLHPGEFSGPRDWFTVWDGGLSFHGCLITGTLAMFWIAKRRGISLIALMDTAAPGVALGYAIGRIGCFLGGCCYGAACKLPWATRFADPHAPGGLTPPSHPTQIYSSFAGFLIFGFLAWYSPRQKYPGQLALLFLFLYSIYRFVLEFYRKGVSAIVVTQGLTQAQIGSLVIAGISLALMIAAAYYYGRRKPGPPEVTRDERPDAVALR
ncbi:MAG: prolipoprotein diacylglyceryl transferase [Armatimonadetes bacterium]|nr:prolipoprotein diacylglyceryl transferase [Armatimonadota bacterium]